MGNPLRSIPETNSTVLNRETLYHIGSGIKSRTVTLSKGTKFLLFQRFILGSPSLLWDDGVMFKVEEKYGKTHTALPAKIFVSMADNEGYAQAVPDFERLVKVLEQRKYTNLQWTSHVFEGETHVSVLPATISRGLRAIYSEK